MWCLAVDCGICKREEGTGTDGAFAVDEDWGDMMADLQAMMTTLGRDEAARAALIDLLIDWEHRHRAPGYDPREAVTGPLVDSLHAPGELVTRTLDTGLTIALPYRSKIAREFAMARAPLDHVWEPQTTKLLVRLAARARHVLIGGAYAGDQALPVMQAMSPNGGLCHCFEPNAEEAAALARNAARNGLGNYRLRSEGLWRESTAMIFEGDDSHASSRPAADGEDPDFHALSIDGYCASAPGDPVDLDLIMLDIEGGEHDALRGAAGQLARDDGPVLVFEVHRAYLDWSDGLTETDLLRFLGGLGYRCFAVRDYQANLSMPDAPIEIIPADRCHLEGPPHGFNMVAFKDETPIRQLDLRICRDVSPKLLLHRDAALHQPLTAP